MKNFIKMYVETMQWNMQRTSMKFLFIPVKCVCMDGCTHTYAYVYIYINVCMYVHSLAKLKLQMHETT